MTSETKPAILNASEKALLDNLLVKLSGDELEQVRKNLETRITSFKLHPLDSNHKPITRPLTQKYYWSTRTVKKCVVLVHDEKLTLLDLVSFSSDKSDNLPWKFESTFGLSQSLKYIDYMRYSDPNHLPAGDLFKMISEYISQQYEEFTLFIKTPIQCKTTAIGVGEHLLMLSKRDPEYARYAQFVTLSESNTILPNRSRWFAANIAVINVDDLASFESLVSLFAPAGN